MNNNIYDFYPGEGYRWATAQDVGRTDVEFWHGEGWTVGMPLDDFAVSGEVKYYYNRHYVYQSARVPLDKPAERFFDTGKLSDEELAEKLKDQSQWVTLEELCSVRVHTIRRKLEAGGFAPDEQAVLLDGVFYPIDWVKSSPGVLPTNCEVVA